MKIYAVADIHARSRRLENIRAGIDELEPDCVIIAGDIISYFLPGPVFSALDALTVPVFVVRGNSDPSYLDKHFENSFQCYISARPENRFQSDPSGGHQRGRSRAVSVPDTVF